MTEPQIFELNPGQPMTPAVVGKTIVHRPRRDAGSPLFLGVLFGLPGLGLAVVAIMMIAVGWQGLLLTVLVSLLAALFGWLAVPLIADAVRARRFNRSGYEVRFELRDVEIRGPDGVERLVLARAPEHPFLKSLAIDQRIYTLMRVRAMCAARPDGDDVRVVLETLALLAFDDDGDPSARQPCYALVRDGRAIIMRDPEGVQEEEALYRVATEWDASTNAWAPRLTPSAVQRVPRPRR